MKRFIFQFASILKLRKLREDEAMRALGAAQRAHTAVIAEKTELLAKLEEALVRREGLGAVSASKCDFQLEQDFINGQKSRVVRQDQLIIRAQRSVEKAFRTSLGARRQTEMMERLRERHYGEFRVTRARKEQKELEDVVMMRAPLIAAERAESEEDDDLAESELGSPPPSRMDEGAA
jgi:flagellar export protein FliJ